MDTTRNHVFVVYGRNARAHAAVFAFLRSLGAVPIDFEHVRSNMGGAPFIGDIVAEGLQTAQAVLVILTPDEYCSLYSKYRQPADDAAERWQPRPNVLLEAGIAFGIDKQRTVLVTIGNVVLPSDWHGIHCIPLDNSAKARERLRNALIATGCDLPKPDPRWHDPAFAGDFNDALPRAAAAFPFRSSLRTAALAATLGVLMGIALMLVLRIGFGFDLVQRASNREIVDWLNQAELSRMRGDYDVTIESLDKVISSNPPRSLYEYAVDARARALEYRALERGRSVK